MTTPQFSRDVFWLFLFITLSVVLASAIFLLSFVPLLFDDFLLARVYARRDVLVFAIVHAGRDNIRCPGFALLALGIRQAVP